jgi:hypothetical protein
MSKSAATPLSTTVRGPYTVTVHVWNTGVYGSEVFYNGEWIGSSAADSYEDALLEAGQTIAWNVTQVHARVAAQAAADNRRS